ncbi:MAG: hypothetical protein JO199_13235 [Candidatus Eremiobacteraeota bacterium]|nr:hypothetical protein [Candidatus Eremiobacteraeota bacterium]
MKSWRSKSQRNAGFAVAILALWGLSPAVDPKTVVAAAVATLTAERHGVTMNREHYAYGERGPGHNVRNERDELDLRKDGRLVAIRILSESNNGNPASADQIAKDQAQDDRQLPADDYVLPTTASALSDYQFSAGACTECPAGSEAIAFTSVVRDDSHGDGLVAIDLASKHVLWMQFSPSVMPSHVDSASVSMTFGRALPDLWDMLGEKSRYDGHMLFIHGYATVERTDSEYRRFASLDDGLRALHHDETSGRSGSGGSPPSTNGRSFGASHR